MTSNLRNLIQRIQNADMKLKYPHIKMLAKDFSHICIR